tara:strand:+ start:580 stop:1026 length:447 start_codon:yes stop_codon:yes gene_type:complete
MSDYVSKSIKNILINGIQLNLETIEEEQHYILKMLEYFEDETSFTAYLKKDRSIEIETPDMTLAMEVHIVNSTLFMIPYIQDVFEIFTEVLKFISSKHLEIITEVRGSEENIIENPADLNSRLVKEVDETDEKETKEEPDSDDDFEWI